MSSLLKLLFTLCQEHSLCYIIQRKRLTYEGKNPYIPCLLQKMFDQIVKLYQRHLLSYGTQFLKKINLTWQMKNYVCHTSY